MPKDFFEFYGRNRCEIVLAVLGRFADSGAPMFETLSEKEGRLLRPFGMVSACQAA